MRMHQGSVPSSCAPSSSSSTFCCFSSRVPRSSALLPISSSPTSAHYVTLLSSCSVHICPRDTRITATLSSRRPAEGWLSWRREREEMIQDKRGRGWGEEIKKRYIVPRLVDHYGVCIACAFSDDLSLADFLRRSVQSFRPSRGADGCRATAVGGAFGRAYFPAMPAPTTVPPSIDRRHHRQRRQRRRGRRRREASPSSGPCLDYYTFLLLRGHPLVLSLAITPVYNLLLSCRTTCCSTIYISIIVLRASHEYMILKLSF